MRREILYWQWYNDSSCWLGDVLQWVCHSPSRYLVHSALPNWWSGSYGTWRNDWISMLNLTMNNFCSHNVTVWFHTWITLSPRLVYTFLILCLYNTTVCCPRLASAFLIYMQAIHIKAHMYSFEIMFKNSVVCLLNTKDETTLLLSLLAIAMSLTSNQLYWCRRHLLVPDSHSRQSNLTHELCTTTTFALQTSWYRQAPIKT